MDFGGSHINFVPHSPPSYSSSYLSMSSLKDQQIKCVGEVVGDLGKENVGAAPPNKSILKNPTALSLKKQQKKLLKSAAGTSVGSAKKTSADSQTLRKETLKSVAFGRTTRLENTVLANQSKIPTSSTNRTSRTVIFSHEAQALHKLLIAQQAEIAELRAKVDDLIASADDQRRSREEKKTSDADQQQQQTGEVNKQQQKQNPEMLDKGVQAIPERTIFASPSFTSLRTQLPASPILRTAKKEQQIPSASMFPLRDRPLDKQPHQKQNPETVDKPDFMVEEVFGLRSRPQSRHHPQEVQAIPERIFASPSFISLRSQFPASPILRTAKKEQQTPSASMFPLRDASNQEKKLCFD